jgi:hypothetical protein
MFPIGPPGQRRMTISVKRQRQLLTHSKGATSALPGDQYAPTVRYWLFAVVKVLLLIYKNTENTEKKGGPCDLCALWGDNGRHTRGKPLGIERSKITNEQNDEISTRYDADP